MISPSPFPLARLARPTQCARSSPSGRPCVAGKRGARGKRATRTKREAYLRVVDSLPVDVVRVFRALGLRVALGKNLFRSSEGASVEGLFRPKGLSRHGRRRGRREASLFSHSFFLGGGGGGASKMLRWNAGPSTGRSCVRHSRGRLSPTPQLTMVTSFVGGLRR